MPSSPSQPWPSVSDVGGARFLDHAGSRPRRAGRATGAFVVAEEPSAWLWKPLVIAGEGKTRFRARTPLRGDIEENVRVGRSRSARLRGGAGAHGAPSPAPTPSEPVRGANWYASAAVATLNRAWSETARLREFAGVPGHRSAAPAPSASRRGRRPAGGSGARVFPRRSRRSPACYRRRLARGGAPHARHRLGPALLRRHGHRQERQRRRLLHRPPGDLRSGRAHRQARRHRPRRPGLARRRVRPAAHRALVRGRGRHPRAPRRAALGVGGRRSDRDFKRRPSP